MRGKLLDSGEFGRDAVSIVSKVQDCISDLGFEKYVCVCYSVWVYELRVVKMCRVVKLNIIQVITVWVDTKLSCKVVLLSRVFFVDFESDVGVFYEVINFLEISSNFTIFYKNYESFLIFG